MGVETFRRSAAIKAGEMAEDNARMEIRVGFAKDKLIPYTMRFMKELSENLKPLVTRLNKAQGVELSDFLEGARLKSGEVVDPHSIMNLGGITIYCKPESSINIFCGYVPREEIIQVMVGFQPRIEYPQDLWEACSILSRKPIPYLKLKDSSLAEQVTFKMLQFHRRKDAVSSHINKEINVISIKAGWPLICGEEFFAYLSAAWALVADTSFDLL